MMSGPPPGGLSSAPKLNRYPANDESQRPSFSDLRRSVAEVLRVISVRRWVFFVPFCVVTTGAFVLSLYVPRRYEASTTFERRDDPVLMNLPRKGATGAFGILRRTLVQDATNPDNLVGVVDRLGLANENSGTGEADTGHAPRGGRSRAVAAGIAGGLKVFFRHSSPNLDVIEIIYTTRAQETMVAVLDEVRDNYIGMTQRRISKHLRDTKEWFEQECQKRQETVDQLKDDLLRFKTEHRGIDPLNPDVSFIELANLRSDLSELERKGRDLNIRLEGRTRLFQAGPPPGSNDLLPQPAGPVRRSAESIGLSSELRGIESRIEELKSTRSMTDRHPEIIALRGQWDRVALDLEQQQARDAAFTMVNGVGPMTLPGWSAPRPADPWSAARSQAESDITVLRELLADNEAEILRQRSVVAELEALQSGAVEHQQEFRARQATIDRSNEDLALYQRYADQVGRLLAADSSQRGVLFEKIRPARGSSVPVSPRVSTVVLFTLAAGLVSGVVMVLLSELFDRTIRTRRQVSRILGLIILESIDEIVGAASRRRRLLFRALLVPAATTALAGMVVLSGSVAYLSLANRSLYERAIAAPRSALNGLVRDWISERPVAAASLAEQERSG